jgi:hypothetical protein
MMGSIYGALVMDYSTQLDNGTLWNRYEFFNRPNCLVLEGYCSYCKSYIYYRNSLVIASMECPVCGCAVHMDSVMYPADRGVEPICQ